MSVSPLHWCSKCPPSLVSNLLPNCNGSFNLCSNIASLSGHLTPLLGSSSIISASQRHLSFSCSSPSSSFFSQPEARNSPCVLYSHSVQGRPNTAVLSWTRKKKTKAGVRTRNGTLIFQIFSHQCAHWVLERHKGQLACTIHTEVLCNNGSTLHLTECTFTFSLECLSSSGWIRVHRIVPTYNNRFF